MPLCFYAGIFNLDLRLNQAKFDLWLNFRSGVKFARGWREPHFAKIEAEHLAKQAKLFKFTSKYPEAQFLDR